MSEYHFREQFRILCQYKTLYTFANLKNEVEMSGAVYPLSCFSFLKLFGRVKSLVPLLSILKSGGSLE